MIPWKFRIEITRQKPTPTDKLPQLHHQYFKLFSALSKFFNAQCIVSSFVPVLINSSRPTVSIPLTSCAHVLLPATFPPNLFDDLQQTSIIARSKLQSPAALTSRATLRCALIIKERAQKSRTSKTHRFSCLLPVLPTDGNPHLILHRILQSRGDRILFLSPNGLVSHRVLELKQAILWVSAARKITLQW